MKKSVFTFVLIASSLVMLALTPFLNNNAALTQEYDKYEIVLIVNTQRTITNINVGQVRLKASLSVQ
jgi:hypothetical protein